MSLGFDREVDLLHVGDTVSLRTFLYDRDDAPVPADDLVTVEFLIQKPDASRVTFTGSVDDDGAGTGQYSDTTLIGQYRVLSSFVLLDGSTQSVRSDFEVIDPFDPPAPSHTEVVAQYVWSKLEDCFDAEDEGPWLRDVTLNTFNESKMAKFIADGLFDINERNPRTQLTIDYFFAAEGEPTADIPLLVKSVLVAVIRHLMRSYVEQPLPQGSPVLFEDRRDYLQRWGAVYQLEKESYEHQVGLFKRRFLGFGKSSILVDTKAGRLLPAPLRVRTTGRGYY